MAKTKQTINMYSPSFKKGKGKSKKKNNKHKSSKPSRGQG